MINNGKTVLIVDDVEDTREMCAYYLSKRGYNVAIAGDGQEALKQAVTLLPDLVLMDLSLPLMGGLEATKRIKSIPRTSHIPIIVLTANYREGPSAVIEAQCEGFLVKPSSPAEILAEVERVLARAQS